MSSSRNRNNNNYPWLLPVIGILVVAMIIVAVVAGIRRRDPKPKEIEIDPSDMQNVTDPIAPESEAIVSPHDTIKRFETAFNNGDWEEIGKCVEPSARETYLRQLEKSSGDLEKIRPYMPKLRIEIERMQYAPDHLSADAHLNIFTTQVSGDHAGEEVSNRDVVKMIKVDGEWFFHMEDGQIIQIDPLPEP